MRRMDVFEFGAAKFWPQPVPDMRARKPAGEFAFLTVELITPKQLEMRGEGGRGKVIPGRHRSAAANLLPMFRDGAQSRGLDTGSETVERGVPWGGLTCAR